MHGDFERRHDVKPSSERAFGLVMSVAFAVVAVAGALGAALAAYHVHLKQPRSIEPELDAMNGAYLGPEFGDEDSAARLTTHQLQRPGRADCLHA